MDYARRIIRSILKESIEQPKVEDAIKKHYEVNIVYGDDGEKRTIQPTTLGISKGGNLVVRAFQPYGYTKTKVPHWKLFRLDKIEEWKPTNRIFNEPPGMYNAEGKYNPNGDKTMSQVLLNASFDDIISWENLKKNIDFTEKEKARRNQKRLKGNQSSIQDMSRSKKFGDENFSQTVGPVRKGDKNQTMPNQTDNKLDYTNTRFNGPQYKGEEETYNGLTHDQIMKNIEIWEKDKKRREERKNKINNNYNKI